MCPPMVPPLRQGDGVFPPLVLGPGGASGAIGSADGMHGHDDMEIVGETAAPDDPWT